MRTSLFMALSTTALLAGCNQGGGAGAGGGKVELKTDDEKTFYALGLFEGQRLAMRVKPFNMSPRELSLMQAGMADAMADKKPLVEIKDYQQKLQSMYESRMKAANEKEQVAGKEFLAKAATEPGAQKTESGMVYTILKEGTGPQPAATDKVKVNYKGTLIDGKVFDSSYERGQPAEFPLNGVIKCWTEGVQKLKVGGKAKLVCPSDLAYREHGSPPKIPGNATLVFEVELLEILPPAPPAAPPTPISPTAPIK